MRRLGVFLLAAILFFSPIKSALAASTTGAVYYGFEGYKLLLNSVKFNDKIPAWSYRDAVRVTALSLLKGVGDGKFHPEEKISREEAIAIALRLAGKEADAQKMLDQKTAEYYTNMIDSSEWAVGYLFTAANEGYIIPGDIYTEEWKSKASREEFAAYIGRALGYTPAYGMDQQLAYSFDDSSLFNRDYIPFIEPVLKDGIMVGNSRGTFNPKGIITRGQVAVILGRILDKYPEKFGITKMKATVTGIVHNSTDYIMRADDGSSFTISTDDRRGIVVLNNSSVTDGLKISQNVDIYMKGNTPYLIEVLGNEKVSKSIQNGEVISADKGTVNIRSDAGERSYRITPYTNITLDGKRVSEDELMPGQYVSFTEEYGDIVELAINGEVENPGYSEPGRFYYSGSVVEIDSGHILIRDDSGNTNSLPIPSYVSVNVKPGDLVKAYLNNDGTVSSIEKVEDNMEYAYLYRGRLSSVVGDKLQLDDAQRFDNFRWSDTPSLRLAVSREGQIYDDNMPGSDVQSYIGDYVYVITRMEYGEEMAYRIVVENGHMKEYVDDIDSVDKVTGRFTLPDTDVYIGDGSVILKDGKMVTIDSLERDQTVLTLLDRMGSSNVAPLVMVLDSQPAVRIVWGRIDHINSTTFEADKMYELNGNDWKRVSDLGELYISDDTYIIDRLGDATVISPEEFLNDRYERHPVYENEYFYAAMDGDEVIGMVIFGNDNSDDIRFVTARFDSMSKDSLANLTDMLEYSSFTDKWAPGPSKGYVWTQDALVIKNGRISSMDDIKNGTQLYILLDDSLNGLLIVCGEE
jgi:S-layer homology domain.